MTTPRKNVTLPQAVYDRLAATGTTQDTFGVVVSRLLDEHEERAKIISWATDIVRKRIDQLYASTPTWGESKSAIETLIAEIPCEEIRTAAKEYLDQLDQDNQAWEDEGA